MAKKEDKADRKIQRLQAENAIHIAKLVKSLDRFLNKVEGEDKKGKSGSPSTQNRAIFKENITAVVQGYSKPNSQQVVGPWEFMKNWWGKEDEKKGDEKEPKKPSWWKKLIGPALLVLGGIAAFVMG